MGEQPKRYPRKSHTHVVPRLYLRAWADERTMIATSTRLQAFKAIPLSHAGVRSDAYRRQRPNGDWIDDIEWSLSQAESAAAPALHALISSWPPTADAKNRVGQLMGLQALRGTAFREMATELALGIVEHAQDDHAHGRETGVSQRRLTDAELLKLPARARDATTWGLQMLAWAPRIGAALASMNWMLLEFAEASVATSDHPVVLWPAQRYDSRACANDNVMAVADALEIRIPIGPRHALLLTWLDEPDFATPVPAEPLVAAEINEFTIANADLQIFVPPGNTFALREEAAVLRAIAPRISRELGHHYGRQQLHESRRRSHVVAALRRPIRPGKRRVSRSRRC